MTIVAGSSHWSGSFFDGTGTLSTDTTDTVKAALYTYASRFEGAPGAIPEELFVAGHAISKILRVPITLNATRVTQPATT